MCSSDLARNLARKHFRPDYVGNGPDDLENPFQYYNRVSRYDPDMLTDIDKAFITDWKAGNFAQGGAVSWSNFIKER